MNFQLGFFISKRIEFILHAYILYKIVYNLFSFSNKIPRKYPLPLIMERVTVFSVVGEVRVLYFECLVPLG